MVTVPSNPAAWSDLSADYSRFSHCCTPTEGAPSAAGLRGVSARRTNPGRALTSRAAQLSPGHGRVAGAAAATLCPGQRSREEQHGRAAGAERRQLPDILVTHIPATSDETHLGGLRTAPAAGRPFLPGAGSEYG